jgi:MFS family permease
MLFEFPTGYLADRLGYRRSLILGALCIALGWFTYALTASFSSFLVAEILLGLGTAFSSGADSALLHDSLVAEGKKGDYKHRENQMTAISAVSEASAAILGGLLAMVSLSLPFWVRAFITLLMIPTAYLLTDTKDHAATRTHDILGDMKRIFSYTANHVQLRSVIALSAVVSAGNLCAIWFVQPYLKLTGVSLGWYGVVWALLNGSLVLFAIMAEHIERRLGEFRSLQLLIGAQFAAFIALALLPAHALFVAIFFMFYFARAMTQSFSQIYVQTHALEDARASILSIQSLLFRLAFAIIAPILGLAVNGSLTGALIATAVIVGAISVGCLALFQRSKA